MNGAESLARTLAAGGVEVCFANPGTSEMHFVAALDQVRGIRSVLCLFEGVVTGAADGYARMAEKPAATLLHLGPGLSNGLANLHNAKRARSPVVNIVGEHATSHRRFDAPLTADIEALAGQYSAWMRTSTDSRAVAEDGAHAIAAALTPPGQIATLILPADTAWGEGGQVVPVPPIPARGMVDEDRIRSAREALRSGARTLLLLGDRAVRADGLELATRISAKTGAQYLAQTSNARLERGAGRPAIERVPYPVDAALQALADFDHIVLVGATPPVAFFGYPGKPSELAAPQCTILTLAAPHEDQIDALARLADAVVAPRRVSLPPVRRAEVPPNGPLTPTSIAAVLGALIPDQAIICDESVSTGRAFFSQTHGAPPHDWLQLTGGSIGLGIPMAVGAAIACPDRKVIALQADGSGLYTVQGLWTQAREKLSILTCIWSNRSYAILRGELSAVGALNPGPTALNMLSLDHPAIDWVSVARGFGVEARRVATVREFAESFRDGLGPGPFLIEVLVDAWRISLGPRSVAPTASCIPLRHRYSRGEGSSGEEHAMSGAGPFLTRRTFLRAAAMGAAASAAPARAQSPAGAWPTRTVRLIVPYPAGGSTDVLARIIAERLEKKLGQPWIIDNRPGAGGNIGIDGLAKSDPDGYTVGAATVGHFSINQFLYRRMPYDAERDILPVSLTWELPNVAVVPSQHVPAKTLQEFIDWAKTRPDGVLFGSPGVGTTPHLCGTLLGTRTGFKATHVPFRGAAATIPAMLSGNVNYAIDNLASYMGVIASGDMRALAVTSDKRWPTLPDVPTMAEAGLQDFVVTSWGAFVVPKNTPRGIVDKLSTEMREMAADPSIQSRFQAAGASLIASTPEEVLARAARERPIWQEMVRVSGAQLD